LFQGLLNEKDQENLQLKNELNRLKDQMPSSTGDDDDMVMRLVEERVKQWKVCFPSHGFLLIYSSILISRIFLKQKMMKSMILNEE
jgi:hypothetical protein